MYRQHYGNVQGDNSERHHVLHQVYQYILVLLPERLQDPRQCPKRYLYHDAYSNGCRIGPERYTPGIPKYY